MQEIRLLKCSHDTEAWSNDAENSGKFRSLIGINDIFQHIIQVVITFFTFNTNFFFLCI